MLNFKELQSHSRLALALALVLNACVPPAATPRDVETDTPPKSSPSSVEVLPTEVLLPTEATVTTVLKVTAVSTVVPTVESTPRPANPYKGVVFDQRCWINPDANNARPVVQCEEPWAELPLPGGCPDAYRNFMGASSCNAAATAFVLNELVPSEVFMRIIGRPGITPETLVYEVYPNLPGGMGLRMTCDGAGVPHIRAVLVYFGLQVEELPISEYSVAGVVKNLDSNQRLMVSVIGDRATRPGQSKHWSVASGTAVNKLGNETATYHDSFFYEDPNSSGEARNVHAVILEHSPKYKDDPGNFQTGKAFSYVGAFVVSVPDSFEQVNVPFPKPETYVDYQTEKVANDPRFYYLPINYPEGGSPRIVDEPIPIGGGKYRVQMRYDGRTYEYYYYDPIYGGQALPPLDKQLYFSWNGYAMPIYSQFDPRWGPKFLVSPNTSTGKYEGFGRKGCGQTILASILGMGPAYETPGTPGVDVIDPYGVYEMFFPYLTGGRGTYPKDYLSIYTNYNMMAEFLVSSPRAVEKAVDEGKLVMIHGKVDFAWWASDSTVDHFVLAIGRDAKGEVLLYDPFWGNPFVTKLKDVDFAKSSGVYSVLVPAAR